MLLEVQIMNNYTKRLILSLCALLLAAPVTSVAEENLDPNTRKCIPTRTLTSTSVIDDRNVLFYMIGKKVYRNILPKQCSGLLGNSFDYGNLAGSLCKFDTIRVIDGGRGTYGKVCRLGDFHEVTAEDIPEIAALVNKRPSARKLPSAEVEDISTEDDAGEDPQ